MVQIVGQMVLGLGLFFIGMHLVGENLRHLSSRGFRSLVARFTADSFRGSLLGFLFGAFMQSATAVTFIMVNMVGSGLVGFRQALPIIAWANVGLTVLAFVAGLNIHTEVLYLVGLSGLALAFLKRPGAQLAAGVCVGISLLLFGLQTISAGARPLHELSWFQTLLHETVHSPLIGFVVGLLLALLVQSNTAATLIVIALAAAGALDLRQATMVIYGTNLGTIGIRIVLAMGLRGSAAQLVRFEDLFCLLSGVVMIVLFYAEEWLHLPLVAALARAVSADLSFQLALVFFLSNLLPALLLWPMRTLVEKSLARLWPAGKEEADAVPKFLHSLAHGDPATALDLVTREQARLLRHAGCYLQSIGPAPAAQGRADIHRAFASLAQAIDEFVDDLARDSASIRLADRMRLAQEELVLIGYLEDAASELAETLSRVSPAVAAGVVTPLAEIWGLAVRAADNLLEEEIDKLRDATHGNATLIDTLKKQLIGPQSPSDSLPLTAALDVSGAVERLAWMLHRLSKILTRLSRHRETSHSPRG